MLNEDTVLYTADRIRLNIKPLYQAYYSKLSVNRPDNWKCDQRTADIFCLSQWISDELTTLLSSDVDRRDVLSYFNRKTRAEEDVYEVAARAINSFLENKIERIRRK